MEALGNLSDAGRTVIQGRLKENTPSDATASCSAIPAQPRQNMPQKSPFLLQGLAKFSFCFFIHVPPNCSYRSLLSASYIQYSLFMLKWPNWLEVILQWQVCRQTLLWVSDEAAGLNRSTSFLFWNGESTFLGGNSELERLHRYLCEVI